MTDGNQYSRNIIVILVRSPAHWPLLSTPVTFAFASAFTRADLPGALPATGSIECIGAMRFNDFRPIVVAALLVVIMMMMAVIC